MCLNFRCFIFIYEVTLGSKRMVWNVENYKMYDIINTNIFKFIIRYIRKEDTYAKIVVKTRKDTAIWKYYISFGSWYHI